MNIYVLYNVISMFVNDREWWSRHIFKKGDPRVEIVRMCFIWRFDLRRYHDSTDKLDSHK